MGVKTSFALRLSLMLGVMVIIGCATDVDPISRLIATSEYTGTYRVHFTDPDVTEFIVLNADSSYYHTLFDGDSLVRCDTSTWTTNVISHSGDARVCLSDFGSYYGWYVPESQRQTVEFAQRTTGMDHPERTCFMLFKSAQDSIYIKRSSVLNDAFVKVD